MQYTNLGQTGLKVSRICLGCMSYGVPERGPHPWSLDEEKSRPFIKRSLELGIRWIVLAHFRVPGGDRLQCVQQMPAALRARRLPDHRKQPRLHTRLAAITRLALQNLQVNRLQNFFGLRVIAPATVQRPAEAGFMQSFEFCFEI